MVMISKPFASVVNQTVHSYCLTCHEVDNAFIPCDGCSTVKFCSMQCKMNNKAHEYECGSNYHVFNYEDEEIDIKLAIQIILEALAIFRGEATNLKNFVEDLLRVTANFKKKETLTRLNDGKTRLQSLMSLQSVKSEKIAAEYVQIAFENIMNLPKVQQKFSAPEAQRFLLHFLAHNLAIIAENAFRIPNKDGESRGLIYDSFSYFNHSCSPNVINFVRGNSMVGITGRHIDSGEQLFIRYSNLARMDKEKRKAYLKKCWEFDCECDLCKSNTEITLSQYNRENKKGLHRLESELNISSAWDITRGAQMLVYKEKLQDLLENRNFLKI